MELASGLLFSVVLVILAGLALRHALWLGRDDEAKRASDTINEFEHRTRSLHAALENEHLNQQKLRTRVDQAAHDLASVKQSSDRRLTELTAQREAKAELERQVADQATEQADMQSTIEVLREQLRAVHHEVAEKDSRLRDFIADSQGELAQHAAHVEAKDQEMVEALQRIDALESENTELRGLREQLAHAEKLHRRFDEQVQSLEQELSSLEVENQQLRRDTAEFESVRGEMGRTKRGQHEMAMTIKSLENQLQEAMENKEQLAALRGQCDTAQSQLEVEADRVDRLTRERDELQISLSALATEARELRSLSEVHASERDQQQTEFTQLQCELVDTKSELESELGRRAEAEQELRESGELLGANELELAQLRQKLTKHETRLEAFDDEKSSLASSLESETRMRQEVEEQLRVHAETTEKLRADSKSLEAQLAQQNSLYEQTRRLTSSTEPSKSAVCRGGSDREILSFDEAKRDNPATEDPQLGRLYSQRPQHADDLRRISGVGHVLEEKLNALGIYTYEQIMHWSAETINRFSELLSFKDRIERDQWVAQAARLYKETKFRAA